MIRFAIVMILAAVGRVSTEDVPEFIHVCKRNDPAMEACIMESVEHMKSYLKTGVPEYNLPTLEPLLLKELNAQAAGLQIVASNVNAWGASNFVVKQAKADVDKLKFMVTIDLPHLYVEGSYSIKGSVLLLPITGSGPMHGNFTGCTGVVHFQGELVKDDKGVDRLHVKDFNMKITVKNGNLKLDNLFDGQAVLGDLVNNAINTNFQDFSQELLPLIEKALSETFCDIGNNIVKNFAFDQLFPKD